MGQAISDWKDISLINKQTHLQRKSLHSEVGCLRKEPLERISVCRKKQHGNYPRQQSFQSVRDFVSGPVFGTREAFTGLLEETKEQGGVFHVSKLECVPSQHKHPIFVYGPREQNPVQIWKCGSRTEGKMVEF